MRFIGNETKSEKNSTKDKKKSEPARDPKTGRYVSTKDSSKKSSSSKKSEPARDPKTGRYIKKS
jgi:hypothetical protein